MITDRHIVQRTLWTLRQWAVGPHAVLVSASIAFAPACAPLSVGADFGINTDFSTYQTYAWGPADALPTGDPRLDNNPFFNERVRQAIERNLRERGLRKSTGDDPDVLVHYHATIQQRIDTYTVDREYGYTYGQTETQIHEYEQGTLIMDIAVAETKSVIWRGWAITDIGGSIDNPDRLGKLVDESVSKMLKQFPPER